MKVALQSSLKEGLVRRRMRSILKASTYKLQCRRVSLSSTRAEPSMVELAVIKLRLQGASQIGKRANCVTLHLLISNRQIYTKARSHLSLEMQAVWTGITVPLVPLLVSTYPLVPNPPLMSSLAGLCTIRNTRSCVINAWNPGCASPEKNRRSSMTCRTEDQEKLCLFWCRQLHSQHFLCRYLACSPGNCLRSNCAVHVLPTFYVLRIFHKKRWCLQSSCNYGWSVFVNNLFFLPEASQHNTVSQCVQNLLRVAARSIQHWCRYYTGWKAYSNFKALAGAHALNSCFRVLDSIKLEKLKQELSQLQDSGVVFPKDSWPANLLAKSPRCVVRYFV